MFMQNPSQLIHDMHEIICATDDAELAKSLHEACRSLLTLYCLLHPLPDAPDGK